MLPDSTGFSICANSIIELDNDSVHLATMIDNVTKKAIAETLENATDGFHKADVWYKFNANTNKSKITLDASFDAVIYVYDLNGISDSIYISIADSVSVSGIETLLLGNLTIGDTHYIAINYAAGSSANTPNPSIFNIKVEDISDVGISTAQFEKIQLFQNPIRKTC